jgi:dedicated sortase system histidine kinase
LSLPRQLLLIALVLLLLPVGGWRVAVQVESFLRQAREEALLATSGSLARSWELDGAEQLIASLDGLYVNRIDRPIVTDGYADDWAAWLPFASHFESSDQRLRSDLLLSRDERYLYVLLQVWDQTRSRASFAPSGLSRGDHVLVGIEGRRGIRQFQLLPSVPGTLDVVPASEPGEGPLPLGGAWREQPDGSGYVVEFSLPVALIQHRIGLLAEDTDLPFPGAGPVRVGTLTTGGELALRALAERQPQWSRRLDRIAPEGSRLWLLDRNLRVVASGGQLAPPDSRQHRRWWDGLVYRALTSQTLGSNRNRDPAVNLQLTGSEIRAAVAGQPMVRWEATSGEFNVLASAAVPVSFNEEVAGVLVLEQASDGLLLMANSTVARTVMWSLVLVLVVVAGLMTFASIHSLRIRRLRNAVDSALDRSGQPEMALPAYTANDEIGDLSRSFDALLNELGQYNDYLKTLAGKLSHELNTPLAVVRSSLDNLAQEDLPDSARAYAQRAREGGERLQGILRTMSEAHRVEEALEQHETEDFDLAEVVHGCFEAYRSVAPEFDWQIELPEDGCSLRGSPELIAQLLDKLVDNARSFTPSEGMIRLAVERHRRGPLLRVANDGPMLPDNLRRRLFQSLVSVRETKGDSVHLGLGLHMVRLIAHAHRGGVVARNRPDDQGVEFLVRLRGMLPVDTVPL